MINVLVGLDRDVYTLHITVYLLDLFKTNKEKN